MLEQIFLKVLSMSRAASIAMVVVFVVRILLKRFPKNFSYMLWSVVIFRLLCPFSPELPFGSVPDLQAVFYEYAQGEGMAFPEVLSDSDVRRHTDGDAGDAALSGRTAVSRVSMQDDIGVGLEDLWPEVLILAGKYVWLSGMVTLLLYCVISLVRIRGKVRRAIPFKENIYIGNCETSSQS